MTKIARARMSLRMPASLKAAAEQQARRDGVSLHQFIATALAQKVGAEGAAGFFAERARGGSAARAIGLLRKAPDTPTDDQDVRLC